MPLFNKYRNSIRFEDSLIGAILKAVERAGGLKDTAVLVMGDHGEAFFETGYHGHNRAYSAGEVKVPLVFYVPGRAPSAVKFPTSHMDIVPALMKLIGVKNPPADYSSGTDILAASAPPFTAAFSWDTSALIKDERALVMPLEAYKGGLKLYDADYKVVPGRKALEPYMPYLVDFQKEAKDFINRTYTRTNLMPRIIVLLMLLLTAAADAGPYYFITVRSGAEDLERSHKVLREMVKLADAQHTRLTLSLSAQYAVYVSSDAARTIELETWKGTGHEVAAHETCLAPDNNVKSAAGKRFEDGVNYFLAPAPGRGEGEKRLSCSRPFDRAGVEAAKKAFSGMAAGVYGAAFNSSPSEFGAFFAWLKFLKSRDPQGLFSRTVSGVVDNKLLPDGKAQAAAAARPKTERPGGGSPKTEIRVFRRRIIRTARWKNAFRAGRGNGSAARYCGDGVCDAAKRPVRAAAPRLREIGLMFEGIRDSNALISASAAQGASLPIFAPGSLIETSRAFICSGFVRWPGAVRFPAGMFSGAAWVFRDNGFGRFFGRLYNGGL